MTLMDRLVKHLPWALQRAFYRALERKSDRAQATRTPQEVFTQVYTDGRWGSGGESRFFSGWGSHDDLVVAPYVQAVGDFLKSFATRPDVVDLGCGDFNVGRQLRHLCGNYIACDVVPDLIEHNKSAFSGANVDFRSLDITSDLLPAGEVVFIRQVLQHLSNAQIRNVIGKLHTFKFIVLTEHLPSLPDFEPNLEKGAGDDVRAGRVTPSAVVLTKPPFAFAPRRSTVLCRVPARGGIIQTLVYEV